MTDLSQWFERCVEIDPAGGAPGAAEGALATVPEKPAVYLLATADDAPILLASGLAVRSILRRRLGEPLSDEPETRDKSTPPEELSVESSLTKIEPAKNDSQSSGTAVLGLGGPSHAPPRLSRRADLRPLVRKLYLHVTFSPFETDLWYLWLARRVFPDRCQRMIRPRHCWMIHGDPADSFPRLTVTDRFVPPTGRRFGPISRRQGATKLIELLTGLFGLCHYYQVLRQSPHGRPCEYREMGRCSGVCDGSVSMEAYRGQVAEALNFLADRGAAWRTSQAEAMKAAAGRLDFEQAGRIKDRLARAGELRHADFDRLAEISRTDWLIVQPGATIKELRTWRGLAGRIVPGPTLDRRDPAAGLARWAELTPPPNDPVLHGEEAGLLADYLFRGQRDRGLFVDAVGQLVAQLTEAVTQAWPIKPQRRKP